MVQSVRRLSEILESKKVPISSSKFLMLKNASIESYTFEYLKTIFQINIVLPGHNDVMKQDVAVYEAEKHLSVNLPNRMISKV